MSLKKTYNFLADSGVLVMAVFFLMYLKLFQSSILSRKQEETQPWAQNIVGEIFDLVLNFTPQTSFKVML